MIIESRITLLENRVLEALRIARWLKQRGGRETNTNLNNGLPIHLRRKRAREKPMRLLEEAAWIRKDRNSWFLNPGIPGAWLSKDKRDENDA